MNLCCRHIFFVVLVLFVALARSVPPTPLSATYEIKKAFISGVEYEAAIFDIHFDQDLYLLDNFPCACGYCTNRTAPVVDESNYTIIPLTEHVWYTDELYGVTASRYFKLEVNQSQACSNLKIEIDLYHGAVAIYGSMDNIPTIYNYTWYRPFYGRKFLYVCNSHSQYGIGTFYIQTRVTYSLYYNKYRIRYHFQPNPACQQTAPPPPPEPGFRWLQDGVPVTGSLPQEVYDYYRFRINTSCTNFSVSLQKNATIGDVDLYVSLVNPTPGLYKPRYLVDDWPCFYDGEDTLSINYCSSNVPYDFYISVTTFDNQVGYTLVATTQNTFELLPISDLAPQSAPYVLARSYTMECSDTLTNAKERFFCFFPAYDDCSTDPKLSCCFPLFPVPGSDPTNPFWPWNPGQMKLRELGEANWSSLAYPLHDPRRLTIGLILSYSERGVYKRWVQTRDLSTCTLYWNNQITNARGEAITTPVRFTPASPSCDVAAYNNLSTTVTNLINEMATSANYQQLALTHYDVNFKLLDENWYGCRSWVQNLTAVATLERELTNLYGCYKFPNTTEFATDPCCNYSLDWEQCCQPQNQTITIEMLADVNDEAVNSNCKTPFCSRKKINDLISLEKAINHPNKGCTASFVAAANQREIARYSAFIKYCRDLVMGEYLQGIRCSNDSDCYSGKCDKTFGQCVQDDFDVLRCFAENIDNSIARFLFNNWGISAAVTPTRLVQEFSNRIMANDCVGPDSIRYRDHYWYRRDETTCYDQCFLQNLEPHCLDTSCFVPPICDYAQTGLCYRHWIPTRGDLNQCLNSKACNWDRCVGLNDAECEARCTNSSLSQWFCADCTSGYCEEVVGFNETRCREGLCSFDPNVPPSQCTNSTGGYCSVLCDGGPCMNQTACELSGKCSDRDVFSEWISAMGNSLSGVCIRPKDFAPNGSPICSDTTDIQTSVGCAITNLSAWGSYNQTTCESISGYKWHKFATNATECAASYGCNETRIEGNLISFKDSQQCRQCNAQYVQLYTWTPGVWTPGYVKPLVWMQRSYYSVNHVNRTINYTLLSNEISRAVAAKLSFYYVTDALCRYGNTLNMVGTLLCDCNNNSPNTTCYTGATSTLIGVVYGCAYISSTLHAPPADLTIPNTAIQPLAFCQPIQLYLVSANQYLLSNTLTLTSEIYKKRITNVYAVVYNQNGAVVGQLVTQGIEIVLDETYPVSTPFTLCIDIDPTIPIDNITYSTYDFGILNKTTNTIYAKGSFGIIPQNGSLCADVYPGVYFGIIRLSDDVFESEQPYDTLQSTLAIVGFTIYFAVVTFGIIQFSLVVIFWKSYDVPPKRKLVFISVVIAFNLLRGIYLALPSSSVSTNNFLLQYFLFELPTFLFFSTYTIILFLWSEVLIKQAFLSKAKAKAKIKKVFFVYLFVNIGMYLIFILFILLFNFLPNDSRYPCDLTTSNQTAGQQTRYNLILWYQIFIAVVCLGVSLAFLIQGIQFIKIFMSSKVRNTSGRTGQIRNSITAIAILCTTMFIARTIVFLYAAITGQPVVIIVFVLLETIPSAALLWYLRPFERNPWKSATTRRSSLNQNVSPDRSSVQREVAMTSGSDSVHEENNDTNSPKQTESNKESSKEGNEDNEHLEGKKPNILTSTQPNIILSTDNTEKNVQESDSKRQKNSSNNEDNVRETQEASKSASKSESESESEKDGSTDSTRN